MTLMHSCSGDFPTDSERANENVESLKEDSVLRFLTIDELENISVSDIPGEYSGYTLTGLSYECVDTIELRALRYKVTITLQSPTQQKTNISFTADVGPELVSVEYYPSAIVIPAHDNMEHNYYGMVERYRNYSDGSRIGPDEFYDFGHPTKIRFLPDYWENIKNIPGVLDHDMDIEEETEKYIKNHYPYENGTFYYIRNHELRVNLNTKVIGEDGRVCSGEDLYPIHWETWRKYYSKEEHERWVYDTFNNNLDNYYNADASGYQSQWLLCRPINIDNPETYDLVNLGRNVPDNSPVPYPEDIKSLQPGWYFSGCMDLDRESNFLESKISSWDGLWTKNCITLYPDMRNFRSYLIIDGRIIHLDNLMKGYEGIRNINYDLKITKVADGYKVRAEASAHLYGEKFAGVYNLHIKE